MSLAALLQAAARTASGLSDNFSISISRKFSLKLGVALCLFELELPGPFCYAFVTAG
jgi:hypothetical protein